MIWENILQGLLGTGKYGKMIVEIFALMYNIHTGRRLHLQSRGRRNNMLFSEQTKELVQGLRPIDDTFFILLGQRKEVCQEMLRTLLDEESLEVLSSETQVAYTGFERSITIDCRCRLSDGRIVNIEMQKDKKNDDIRRTRFHASAITIRECPKGRKFKDVPDVIVIYISEYDALHNGQTFTMERHCILNHGIWEPVEDGERICYVNAAPNREEWSDKKELMSLLVRPDVFTSDKFAELSNAVKYFKQEEGGQAEMCKAVEDYANKKKAEGVEEGIEEAAVTVIKAGKLSLSEAVNMFGIKEENILKKAEEMGVELT